MNRVDRGWEPLGAVSNGIIAKLALRRNVTSDAVARHATAIEQAESTVNTAIAALRALLDAMQPSGDAADDPPAQRKRQA